MLIIANIYRSIHTNREIPGCKKERPSQNALKK